MINWTTFAPLLPEMLLVAIALLVIVLDLLGSKYRDLMPWMTVLGALAVLGMVLGSQDSSSFGGMFVVDRYAIFFKTICLLSVIMVALMSEHYRRIRNMHEGEYYSLLLLSCVGMLIMASAADLMVLYLGLELMALSVYCLVGMNKTDGRSAEAAIKYFLMGAFSSTLFLFGLSLVYGLTGTTDLANISQLVVSEGLLENRALAAGLGLMVVGLCFKVAVAPFHFWTPDVYEGAPTSITAFMSVGPKAAGFAIFGRILSVGFPELHGDMGNMLALLALLTMGIGNITALAQKNIKRMLAYSAVAHAGYALLGLLAGTSEGVAATMSYLFIYAFMNMGAFAVLLLMNSPHSSRENLEDYKGFAKANPLAGILMLVFMFSLTGIPPTAGFAGKFYLLKAALSAGYTFTVIGAVVFSAISAYFYLRVIRYMYMDDPQESFQVSYSPGIAAVLGLALLGVIGMGVFPGTVIGQAVSALFG